MRRMNFTLNSYEGTVLWRFFDSVSSAVSMRMLRGSPPGEENLTFLLCELLDEDATGLHALEYPLSRVKQELEKSDAGISVDVSFETHEHSKFVEAKHSGADLGLVLSIDHPLLGQSKRAVLLQAKRLFGNSRSKEFSLHSVYSSYDKPQADFLKQLAERFDTSNSVFYLWYNPPSSGFSDAEAKLVRAYESQGSAFSSYWGRMHPYLDELIEMGFPLPFGGHQPIGSPNQEDEEHAREWRTRQPALRITSLDAVLSLTGSRSAPQLKSLYDALIARHDRVSFSPFADFCILALANNRYGSSSEPWVQLAEGRKVPMPPSKQAKDATSAGPLDHLQQPPVPRHTLRVAVTSTLPRIG